MQKYRHVSPVGVKHKTQTHTKMKRKIAGECEVMVEINESQFVASIKITRKESRRNKKKY